MELDFLLTVLLMITSLIVPVFYLVTKRQFSFFHPVLLAMVGFVPILIQFIYYGDYLITSFGWNVVLVFASEFILAALMICWGAESRIPIAIAKKFKIPEIKPNFLLKAGIFWITIGVFGYAVFIAQSGGASQFFSEARGAGDYESSTAWIWEMRFLFNTGVLMIIGGLRDEVGRIRNQWKYLALLLATVWFLFSIGIGQRSSTVTALYTFVIAFSLAFRKLPKLSLILPFALAAYFFYGFIVLYRGEFYLGSNFNHLRENFSVQEVLLAPFTTEDELESPGGGREVPAAMLFIKTIPKEVDFSYGYEFLELFTRPIPRVLWPEKIYPARVQWYQVWERAGAGPKFNGPTITLIGTYHRTGGIIAVGILSFISGVIFKIPYAYFVFNSNSGIRLVIMLLFLLYPMGAVLIEGAMVSGIIGISSSTIIPLFLTISTYNFIFRPSRNKLRYAQK